MINEKTSLQLVRYLFYMGFSARDDEIRMHETECINELKDN